jgi:hypothetical protein
MNWQNKKINSTEEERNEKPISEPAGLFVSLIHNIRLFSELRITS